MAVENLTAEQLQVLAIRLTDIGETCRVLREAGADVIMDAEGEKNGFHGSVIEKLATHAGALADVCITMLEGNGLGVVCGDFTEWRMSPLEREHVERIKQRA